MADREGLFPVAYRVTNGMLGATTLTMHLVVDAPTGTVHGAGRITNTDSPPVDEPTRVEGDFTYMTVMPNDTRILLVLDGSGPLGTITPLIGPNLRFRAVLSGDWKTGTANYSYNVDSKPDWISENDVPMELIT